MHPTKLAGLDSSFWCHLRLSCEGAHSAVLSQTIPDTWIYKNHPFCFVSLSGIVVGISRHGSRNIYTIDDSTGLMPCVMFLSSNNDGILPEIPLKLGDSIDVQGKLNTFREERQVVIKTWQKATDDVNWQMLRQLEMIEADRELEKYSVGRLT